MIDYWVYLYCCLAMFLRIKTLNSVSIFHFSSRNKDILVSLNGIKILGSFTHDNADVVEMFRNLPMSKTISMVI